jgi:rod shape-determining protein MreC
MTRRLLLAAAAVTALVLLLDLSGAVDLGRVRGTAAAALGPLERLAGPRDDELSRVTAESTRTSAELDGARRRLSEATDVEALLAEPSLADRPLVLARVVAVGASGPAGPERVTIDAGSRDGIEVDRTVVAVDGLVGRVVSVAPWTSDVLLVGAPGLSVGVRVGASGVLGEASGTAAAAGPAPEPGRLSLALVERGEMARGDAVRTLGSVGGRPFVAGVHVGTVGEVQRSAARLAQTGTLVPAVDTTTLDVVAVVLDPARTAPRPVLTPGAVGSEEDER